MCNFLSVVVFSISRDRQFKSICNGRERKLHISYTSVYNHLLLIKINFKNKKSAFNQHLQVTSGCWTNRTERALMCYLGRGTPGWPAEPPAEPLAGSCEPSWCSGSDSWPCSTHPDWLSCRYKENMWMICETLRCAPHCAGLKPTRPPQNGHYCPYVPTFPGRAGWAVYRRWWKLPQRLNVSSSSPPGWHEGHWTAAENAFYLQTEQSTHSLHGTNHPDWTTNSIKTFSSIWDPFIAIYRWGWGRLTSHGPCLRSNSASCIDFYDSSAHVGVYLLPDCFCWFISLFKIKQIEERKTVGTTNFLANSCLFTHPAVTERRRHPFEVVFLTTWQTQIQYSPSFSSNFGIYQLLRVISVSLAAKCSTMFTS